MSDVEVLKEIEVSTFDRLLRIRLEDSRLCLRWRNMVEQRSFLLRPRSVVWGTSRLLTWEYRLDNCGPRGSIVFIQLQSLSRIGSLYLALKVEEEQRGRHCGIAVRSKAREGGDLSSLARSS